jgi:prepilin-type N-terminal cleavage/methylation domain-containing protein
MTGRASQGFTLLELLVATSVVVVAFGLLVSLTVPMAFVFHAVPDAIDTQQRLRSFVQLIAADLAGAGAGPVGGWGATAPLSWPAVLPCRWTGGALSQMAAGCADASAITLLTIDAAAPQAITTRAAATTVAPLEVGAVSGCPLTASACRFQAGTRVLVVDGTGAWDFVTVTAVSADGAFLEHGQDRLSRLYGPGALVSEARYTSWTWRPDASSGVMQMRRGSSPSAESPFADHVAGFAVSWFGAPEGPAISEPVGGARTASYGPLPPLAGEDDPADTWPAGENCTTARMGTAPVSRLSALPVVEAGLASLTLSSLTDGPWCPDAASPNRFDADLLRLRLARIAVRLQAQPAVARGSARALFANPGTGRDASRLTPDLEVRLDVSLRSLRH